MLSFLKYVFATLVGLILFFTFIVVVGLAIIVSAIPEEKTSIDSHSVLRLKLDAPIVEREPDDIWSRFKPFSGNENVIGLIELKEAIAKAKTDSSIQGIYIETPAVDAGYATLQELRNALIDFKTSKKFIVAYSEFYTEKSYYLASVADKIYLPSTGMLELNGLETEIMFVKGTLEKLELKPEVFKVGDFKSAVEPLLLDKMSEPNKIQTTSFLNSINNTSLMDIANARNLDFKDLQNISDSMLIRTANDALTHGLITNVDYYDQAESFIRKRLKLEETDKVNFVNYETYKNKIQAKATPLNSDKSQIAVIVASGDINSGKGENAIGSETLCEELRNARLDENIKAVVLRINSPGGSALASDIIWREVQLMKKTKPIIASMSDVAASGGYYIAMGCNSIVAQPNTITGSIGVFGVLINAQNLLKNKLGITVDRVTTGKYSDMGSITRPITEVEKKMIQQEVERIYEDFVGKAAEGRNMSTDALKAVASGRVWSGSEAKENGLIDVYGGLDDAVKLAATKAKIKDYDVKYLPEQKNQFLNQFINQLNDREEEALVNHFGVFYSYIKTVNDIKKLEGVQAKMPFDIHIK